MGQEFGQTTEWDEAHSVNWANLEGWGSEYHQGIQRLVRDANTLYTDLPALYSQDNTPDGFTWLKGDDWQNNILAYVRWGDDGSALVAVINLSGTTHTSYRVGLPREGQWELVLNTDADIYSGAGQVQPGNVTAEYEPWDGQGFSAEMVLPALSVQWYVQR